MVSSQDNKAHHRIVTAVSLGFALLLYVAARFGLLGVGLQEYSAAYLLLMLVILGIRAVLTETGVRRRRFAFEKRMTGNGEEGH
jgi:small-conductance mechanosensitive channel